MSDTLQPHGLKENPTGSSVHGILLARILEQVAISYSIDRSIDLQIIGIPQSDHGRGNM